MAVRTTASTQNYSRTLSLGSQTKFSVTCWVKISVDRGANCAVWWIQASGADFLTLATNSADTSMLFFENNVVRIFGPVFTVGSWYFVGISWNAGASTMTLRELGASSFTTQTGTGGAATHTCTSLFLSNSQAGGSGGLYLNGCIAAVKGWSGVALTEAQLQNEAWSYLPKYAAPTFFYPLLTTSTTDYSGNAYTLSGGTSATTEDGPGVGWGWSPAGLYIPPMVHELASVGTDTDVSTAVLAVKRSLAAVGLDTDASIAVLNVRRTLSATGLDTDASTAALIVRGVLVATGTDADVSTAALRLTIPLASVGTDSEVSTADMLVAAELSAAGADTDAGTATLQISSDLAATGLDADVGTAALHVTHALAAVGEDTDAGAASLIAHITLEATGIDEDAATATFQAVHAFGSAGLDADASSADLSLTITLGTAVGLDADSSSADLTLELALAADAGVDTDGSNAVLYIALPYTPGESGTSGSGGGGLATGDDGRTRAGGTNSGVSGG
jgi:hypothetical protein